MAEGSNSSLVIYDSDQFDSDANGDGQVISLLDGLQQPAPFELSQKQHLCGTHHL